VIAGSTAPDTSVSGTFPERQPFLARDREHTTIVIVATDARLDKVECRLMAESAHDGFARALHPAHTRADGDLAFALATGRRTVASLDRLRVVAADVVASAIRSAVRR
jgi:L-aminopeptidase/D-esterase-like protein